MKLSPIIFLCSVFSSISPVIAGEIELYIDSLTLNKMISKFNASGSGHKDVWVSAHCLDCVNPTIIDMVPIRDEYDSKREEDDYTGRSSGTNGPTIEICESYALVECWGHFVQGEEWFWNIIGPRIDINTEHGVRLQGVIQVTYMSVNTYLPFEREVTITYDTSNSMIIFYLSDPRFRIDAIVDGQSYNLGAINLGSYFSYKMLAAGIVNLPEGVMANAKLNNFRTSIIDNTLKLSGDLSIR